MIPHPLHPAIVHFPIVLMLLLPIATLAALIAIGRGASARVSWLPVVGIAAALTLSAWAAVETGEGEEERVERVVPRSVIHEHEESAEIFFPLTVVALLIVAGGLARERPGRVLRGTAVVAAFVVAGAGYRVGHSGGSMVYEHGAASAYAVPNGSIGSGEDERGERH